MPYFTQKKDFEISSVNAVVERYIDENYNPTNGVGIRKEQGTFYYVGEMHDYWEIVYVEKGKLTVSEDEKIYELSEGQVIFHAPMEFHSFWAKSDDFPIKLKIFSFGIETDLKHNLSKGVFTLDIYQKENFSEIFEVLLKYCDKNIKADAEDRNYAEEIHTLKKLETFLLGIILENSPDRTLNAKAGAKRYQEIVGILKENIHNKLTVEQIADLSHLSVTYIKKIFSLYAGCGVMQYFMRLKTAKAIKYLKDGYNVGEVAEMLSFSSLNYFSAAFKKETGHSPGIYKSK